MVVPADNKTDYGSITTVAASQVLVVSGGGGQPTSTVLTNRNPASRSVHSSSQSLSVNSNFGSLSSNNNTPSIHTHTGSTTLRQNSETSITGSCRGRVPPVGLELALSLVREATSNSGVNGNLNGSNNVISLDNRDKKFAANNSYSNSSSPMSTNSGDLYQRQPLLQDCKNDWGNDGPEDLIRSDTSYEEKRNGLTRIEITADNIRDSDENEVTRRYPREKKKTLIAFLFLSFNFIMATVSLALTHERLPDYPPLPDIFLDNISAKDWALDVSEILIMLLVISTTIILLLHKHRWIVFRRTFIILGVLYLMRSICMYVTVLPKSSPTYYCSPKANSTSFLIIAKRAIKLISGMGLSINGQQVYCGDFIFSGHTVILVTAYLLIQEYTPKKKAWILHWIAWMASVTGVVMVLIARGHYTIDILVAYYVTTRTFWIYHSLAHNAQLKMASSTNYLSRVWWFPLFQYLEGKVGSPLPNKYSYPWSKSHRSRRSVFD